MSCRHTNLNQVHIEEIKLCTESIVGNVEDAADTSCRHYLLYISTVTLERRSTIQAHFSLLFWVTV